MSLLGAGIALASSLLGKKTSSSVGQSAGDKLAKLQYSNAKTMNPITLASQLSLAKMAGISGVDDYAKSLYGTRGSTYGQILGYGPKAGDWTGSLADPKNWNSNIAADQISSYLRSLASTSKVDNVDAHLGKWLASKYYDTPATTANTANVNTSTDAGTGNENKLFGENGILARALSKETDDQHWQKAFDKYFSPTQLLEIQDYIRSMPGAYNSTYGTDTASSSGTSSDSDIYGGVYTTPEEQAIIARSTNQANDTIRTSARELYSSLVDQGVDPEDAAARAQTWQSNQMTNAKLTGEGNLRDSAIETKWDRLLTMAGLSSSTNGSSGMSETNPISSASYTAGVNDSTNSDYADLASELASLLSKKSTTQKATSSMLYGLW